MIINNIKIHNEGYVFCKSTFYSSHDIIPSGTSYTFAPGINQLSGEIDSGVWAISYLLSMYGYNERDFILEKQPIVILNEKTILLNELVSCACYMDQLHHLFSTNKSVRECVIEGLNLYDDFCTVENVREIFQIDKERFERTINGVGNEKFKAMAAIGFANQKQLYCFPWLSKLRFDSYHEHMKVALAALESLGKTVILPLGK